MSDTTSLVALLRDVLRDPEQLQLPPQIYGELQLRYERYEQHSHLVCTVAAQPKYANMLGQLQEACAGLAFNAVFDAFAALTAKNPCTVISMEQQFIRPIPADGSDFSIETRMRAVHHSFIFLEGFARDRHQKVFATASATLALVKQKA